MNPTDPNQGGMGGGMPTDPNQGGQPAPVSDPNAGQPAVDAPVMPEVPVMPEAPVSESTPAEPVVNAAMPADNTGMGGEQGGQNPTGGAPLV